MLSLVVFLVLISLAPLVCAVSTAAARSSVINDGLRNPPVSSIAIVYAGGSSFTFKNKFVNEIAESQNNLRLPSCCRCSHRRAAECWPRWLRRRLPGSEWGSSCSPPSFGTRNYVLSRIWAADLSSLSLLVVAAKSPRPSSHPHVRTRRARWTNFGHFSDTSGWSRLSASL